MDYVSIKGNSLEVDFNTMNSDTLDNLIRKAREEQARREAKMEARYSDIDDDLEAFV